MCNATQQRVDRLVVQNRDKDLIIQNLEKQIKNLDETLKDVAANTAKAGLVSIREHNMAATGFEIHYKPVLFIF